MFRKVAIDDNKTSRYDDAVLRFYRWTMLSQSAGYAIIALGYVASQHGKPVLIRDISRATNIPTPYLGKIVNALGRSGFVTTQRGIGGGVCLARSAAMVSLYDVCVALNEPIVKQRCMLGVAECTDERACPAHPFWQLYREQYINFLKQTTLEDMAEFEARRQPPSDPGRCV